jgi:hypothetical protein
MLRGRPGGWVLALLLRITAALIYRPGGSSESTRMTARATASGRLRRRMLKLLVGHWQTLSAGQPEWALAAYYYTYVQVIMSSHSIRVMPDSELELEACQ